MVGFYQVQRHKELLSAVNFRVSVWNVLPLSKTQHAFRLRWYIFSLSVFVQFVKFLININELWDDRTYDTFNYLYDCLINKIHCSVYVWVSMLPPRRGVMEPWPWNTRLPITTPIIGRIMFIKVHNSYDNDELRS